MAESYRRMEKLEDALPANEIRVRRGVGIGRYLKRAWELLNDTESQNDTVVIKGVSNAVQSAVNLAELIKHRVKGLHQINKISNINIVDEYEPLVEGLDHLKFSRIVTMLQITLTKSAVVDTTDIGYQVPIEESEVQEYNERERLEEGKERKRAPRGEGQRGGRRGRGRGRGGRGRGGGDRREDGEDVHRGDRKDDDRRGERRERREGGGRRNNDEGQDNRDGPRNNDRNGDRRGPRNNDRAEGDRRGPRNNDRAEGDRRGPRNNDRADDRRGPRNNDRAEETPAGPSNTLFVGNLGFRTEQWAIEEFF
jgi:DNA-binding protein